MSRGDRRGSILAKVLVGISFELLASAASTAPVKKPFTVADSIEWASVLDFSGDGSTIQDSGKALFSPDRSKFILHTARGDLARNAVVESLLLFDTFAVERSIQQPAHHSARKPRILSEAIITEPTGGISSISWINNDEIGFIAPGDNHVNQAFVANALSMAVAQVTHSKEPVVSFAAVHDKVLFYARRASQPRTLINAVDRKTLGDLIFPTEPDSAPLQLYVGSRSGGTFKRLDSPAARLYEPFWGIWMSPSGRYAVVFIPATNAPAYWAEYAIPDHERFGYRPDKARADPESEDLLFRTRYALVDLENESIRPLLDAPSGWLSGNMTLFSVFWASDESSVIVSNTYTPLQHAIGADRQQRQLLPAVAEIDLRSGNSRVAFWEAVLTDEMSAAGKRLPYRVIGLDWDPVSATLEVQTRSRKSAHETFRFSTERIQKQGGVWHTVSKRPTSPSGKFLSIELRQSLNERPKVYSVLGKRQRMLFDPNPQADDLNFGHAEVFRWKDTQNKVDWQGGLIYPPGHVKRNRYPLIIQTHGFDVGQFLLDGPPSPSGGSTAMAAQAFTNAGFLVLQVEDNALAQTGDEKEGPLFAAGLRSAVESLTASALIDPARVGLIAFSRTGLYAVNALALYPKLFTAVNISDAVQPGYLGAFLLSVNLAPEIATEMQRINSGVFNIAQPGDWFARNPLYRIGSSPAAVRLEANTLGSVLGLWETYAVLRSSGRAVDMVVFDQGNHVQTRPAERLASQGGNMDWFRFWLQNVEDPSAAKAEQYVRWRELRTQQSAPQ